MSQVNHFAAYIYEVDGLTPWEKLRNIRNFLEDRRHAYLVNKDALEKLDENPQTPTEIELHEFELARSKSLMEDCEIEIEFLEKAEKELMEQCEKTRVEGKTDKEMYEINFYEEMTARNVLKAKSEIASLGHMTPTTMEAVIRHKPTALALNNLGFITDKVLELSYSGAEQHHPKLLQDYAPSGLLLESDND